MNIHATGLKAGPVDADVDARTLVRGPNATGKSSVADALVWALLGYVPRLGRTAEATAQLMRGREMAATVTLGDGRTIRRTLARTDKGGLRGTVECSWLGRAKARDEEHDTAILKLLGAESADAVESCDVRELLRLTPPQRATRLQALLEVATDADAVAADVARYTLQRLARVDDDRMPDDYLTLRPLVPGYDADGQHFGVYAALRQLVPEMRAKLAEVQLVGALRWANEQKLVAQRGLAPAEQARERLATRVRELGPDRTSELAALDTRRSEIDQEIGAAQARQAEVDRRRRVVADASRALSAAQAQHAAAVTAREYDEDTRPDIDDLRTRLAEAERSARVVQLPAPPDDAEAALLEARARDLDAQAAAIEIPAQVDATAATARVAHLERLLRAAEGSPWARVVAIAGEVDGMLDRGAKGRTTMVADVRGLTDELRVMAAAQDGDPAPIAAALAESRAALAATSADAQRIGESIAAARRRLAELRAEAGECRRQALEARSRTRAEYESARADSEQQSAQRRREIDSLRGQIARAESDDTRTLAALEQATAALQAAEQRARDAGGPVAGAAGETGIDGLRAEMADVEAQIETIRSAVVTRRELGHICAEIDALTARRDACTALEWGLKRVRDEQVAAQGGPLIERMLTVLRGAGMPQVPWITGGDLGWTTAAGDSVSVAALSGAEYVVYLAALSAGIQALRGAPLRLLIVEASECDAHTLSRLMRGLSAAGDDLTDALVLTHLPAPDVAGWSVIDLDARGAA